MVTNANLPIHCSGEAGAVTMSSSEYHLYMVSSLGRDMQGLEITGSSCVDFWTCDQWGIVTGGKYEMRSCVCGLHKPSLI